VLFLVFGSSGAGKTAAITALDGRVDRLAAHDYDEIGIPPEPTTATRQAQNEVWVRRGLGYESEGLDLLLAGQTPFGEVLAAPSASRLEAISACLLDCDDPTRVRRLRPRGEQWLAQVGTDLQTFLNWAAWMRMHAVDPQWMPSVIQAEAAEGQRWDRYSDWAEGDARWRVRVIDTSPLTIDEAADELASWVSDERAALRAAAHPLHRGVLPE
jgi:hypothetical protein